MLWVTDDLLGFPDLDDLAVLHHGDARGQVAHHRHGVRNKQISQFVVALQPRQQVDDLRPHTNIQRRDRLIAYDQFRPQGQGARDPDALPLASGKLVRIARQRRFIQPHHLQQLRRRARISRTRIRGSSEPNGS